MDVIIMFPFMMDADKKEMKNFVLMEDKRRSMVKPKAKSAYPDSHHIIPAHTFQETAYPSLDVTEEKQLFQVLSHLQLLTYSS